MEQPSMQRRIQPGAGQESVWDYPRPPRVEATDKHVQVIFNGIVIADTRRARRVLETSHPPVYYISPDDVQMQYLAPEAETSWCEWKGRAGYIAFYPGKMELCTVDREHVQPQPGNFYGGWITGDIVGPFKGWPGTRGW
jgi:uncharacterized protein (DUF427 family)